MFSNYIIIVFAIYTQCSAESPSERIVGGHPIKISHVPWQVSLKYLPYDVHTCGGSIISDQWILTAAHCLVDLQPRQILVNAGTTDSLVNGSIHEIASTTIHPCYTDFSLDKDFALIRLKVSLKFDEKIQLIQLADNNAPDGRKCLVTGWGIRSNTATVTEKLLRGTNVRIVNQQRCRQAYGMDHITSSMLCAGCLGVGRNDSCSGDSGGPLVAFDGKNGRPVLIGVVSWGYECGHPEYPGVYARVAYARSWIRRVTGV